MKAVCSFSGGKDSTMALYHGGREHEISQLFTITSKEGFSRSHGIPKSVLAKQGEALSIPIQSAAAEWETYEEVFERHLREFVERGFEAMIFGDIDIEDHREWTKKICERVGLTAIQPLWLRDQKSLIEEFILSGFKATIVSLNTEYLPVDLLGEELTLQLIKTFIERGITPAGERGEYHTLVTGGPLFQEEMMIEEEGVEIDQKSDQAFLSFSLKESKRDR